MKVFPAFLLLFSITSSHLHKRDICNVESFHDPLIDDGPAITDALEKCGGSGSVVFPANQTFTLRSPVDLSACRACAIRIDGRITVSPDWDYWEKQFAVFLISNASAMVVDSPDSTGIIDARNFGWGGGSPPQARIPKLFSITDSSYQIHIRDLKITNSPGTAFFIGSQASAVRLYDIDIGQSTSGVREGVVIEDSNHVYVWNNTIHATDACIKVLPNTENVQVEHSTCTISIDGPLNTEPSGININFGAQSDRNWIRNVLVRGLAAVGSMNVVSFQAPPDAVPGSEFEVTNATFSEFNISGAKRAVLLEQGEVSLNATLVMFSQIKGEVETQDPEGLKCKHESDVCDFRVLDYLFTLDVEKAHDNNGTNLLQHIVAKEVQGIPDVSLSLEN
ncbi:glycoside hydrolase family 28 protein [Aaosphaeria arxii CBS 175.79]|uniref:Glycoside hydrolase family 28 protein n=1 Tax=Aaosphaeria arxii CBS 175.79 TaxID=1450172 RepID=A0A6A5XWT5_9PLEO|nr:glycoside hydrolase family 28 protein [Aaosphaeria arxii CBS 175.79]KAF2017805.1 glycoside hydrolase family 28 protein [Aaosphaeria arxii CBS 175.79]